MSYNLVWWKTGKKGMKIPYPSRTIAWKRWFSNKYYALRFWRILTKYVPKREWLPIEYSNRQGYTRRGPR